MTLGAVRTIIVCKSGVPGVPGVPCPAGHGPESEDAYVLFPGSSSAFSQLNETFDAATAAQFFSLSLLTVLTFFLVAYAARQIIKATNF